MNVTPLKKPGKISLGMKVIIREGSAGRYLNALKDLYRIHPI
jgi:adenine deaminase